MALLHRNNDLRECGATTIVTGQSTVFAGGELVAVVGDQCSHDDGAFLDNVRTIFINSLRVIGVGDDAEDDQEGEDGHTNTNAFTGISTISIG